MIARGQFCTMDSNGYLEVAGTEAGKPTNFKAGLFVALQKVDNSGGSGGDETCQVACVRSRVIVKVAGAGITIGMPVQTANNNNIRVTGAPSTTVPNTVVGTVYEFPGEPDKIATAAADELVVIDLGIGV